MNAGAGGTVTPSGTIIVDYGASTPITASPDSGYRFVRWTRSGAAAAIADSMQDSTTVSLTADAAVTAEFGSSAGHAEHFAFDYDPQSFTFINGFSSGNFVGSAGGLYPSSGSQFFASGNGNTFSFDSIGMRVSMGDTVGADPYIVRINFAWYNHGQNGGLSFGDFRALYFGSDPSSTVWTQTPDPVLEDTWYTWQGTYTPSPADIGKGWTLTLLCTIPGKSDLAIDFPLDSFAFPVH